MLLPGRWIACRSLSSRCALHGKSFFFFFLEGWGWSIVIFMRTARSPPIGSARCSDLLVFYDVFMCGCYWSCVFFRLFCIKNCCGSDTFSLAASLQRSITCFDSHTNVWTLTNIQAHYCCNSVLPTHTFHFRFLQCILVNLILPSLTLHEIYKYT